MEAGQIVAQHPRMEKPLYDDPDGQYRNVPQFFNSCKP